MKRHSYTTEYSQITSYIYVGTNVCCGTHFSKLRRIGIEADIDLETTRSHDPVGRLVTFLWLPTKDRTAPSETQLSIGVSTLDTLVRARVKTYVHCRLGHGRSPTLIAAYFISRGMKVDQAINAIKKKRPEVHLTPSQKKALSRFASARRRKH